MLIRSVLKAQNSRSETRANRLMLPLYLPQLVLLVLHVVDEDFLVCTHVLHDEIVVRRHGQVPSRVIAVGGRGSWLDPGLSVGLGALRAARFARVEHLGRTVGRTRAALTHQAGSAFWVHATSFVEKYLVVARRVRVCDTVGPGRVVELLNFLCYASASHESIIGGVGRLIVWIGARTLLILRATGRGSSCVVLILI